MNQEILLAAVKIGFGAIAGGLTNTIAVWMLFHPYQPPKIFGRWTVRFLHGAIPKNQPRLAAAIGRTVGWIAQWQEMLTDSDQKIARPRQVYLGARQRDYVPLEKRPSTTGSA